MKKTVNWSRYGVAFLVRHKKESLSLIYLFLVGMAFGAIWIFHDNNTDQIAQAANASAIEQNSEIMEISRIIEIAVSDGQPPVEARVMPVREAWRNYAVNVADTVDDKLQISIVIDDLGIVKNKTLDIINLAAPLTLSFLPYAEDLPNVTRFARGRGHELMLHLPMEPKSDFDPGPHAMLTGVPDQQIRDDLLLNLSQFEGYVGVNNHMGSAFTEDPKGLNLLLDEVQKRGLMVLDSRTSRGSLLAKMATGRNIPNLTRDFFLDNEQNVDYILGQLAKLENMARRRGRAIAIGHPYAETIEALSRWLPTLQAKGIVVVPLSHLIKRKYDRSPFTKGGQASAAPH